MRLLKLILGPALAGILLCTPLAATALTAERSLTLDTVLAPQYYGAGEVDGVLHLTISRNGIVQGYYRDADSGEIRDVAGGVEGRHIWLDFGDRELVLIDGTYNGKTIYGYTYLAGRSYTFKATPHAASGYSATRTGKSS